MQRPRHKIGIEFLQLLVGFQLVWTTGQQHIAVPRLIQPEAVWGNGGQPHSCAMFHLIKGCSERNQTQKLLTIKVLLATTEYSPFTTLDPPTAK